MRTGQSGKSRKCLHYSRIRDNLDVLYNWIVFQKIVVEYTIEIETRVDEIHRQDIPSANRPSEVKTISVSSETKGLHNNQSYTIFVLKKYTNACRYSSRPSKLHVFSCGFEVFRISSNFLTRREQAYG